MCCIISWHSSDARSRLWKRDGHNPADVRSSRHLPGEDKRPEGLHPNASHTEASEAADAGILPDNMVAQQWNQYTRGSCCACAIIDVVVIISILLVIVIVTESHIYIAPI